LTNRCAGRRTPSGILDGEHPPVLRAHVDGGRSVDPRRLSGLKDAHAYHGESADGMRRLDSFAGGKSCERDPERFASGDPRRPNEVTCRRPLLPRVRSASHQFRGVLRADLRTRSSMPAVTRMKGGQREPQAAGPVQANIFAAPARTGGRHQRTPPFAPARPREPSGLSTRFVSRQSALKPRKEFAASAREQRPGCTGRLPPG